MYDIIVVGGGPAGMTAALYAQRNGKRALVIEKTGFGGQITHSPKVENYPGFIQMSGNEFAEKLIEQALHLEAEIELDEAKAIEDHGDYKRVICENGSFDGRTVIIATGSKHRQLGVARENDFVGAGVSYCAVCDGAFYRGKTVAVIGGGNTALQEAVMLSDIISCFHNLCDYNICFSGGNKTRDFLIDIMDYQGYIRQIFTGKLFIETARIHHNTHLRPVDCFKTCKCISIFRTAKDGLSIFEVPVRHQSLFFP